MEARECDAQALVGGARTPPFCRNELARELTNGGCGQFRVSAILGPLKGLHYEEEKQS